MRSLRNRHLLVLDAALLALSPFLVFALRFEGFTWSRDQFTIACVFAATSVPLTIAVFFAFGLYSRLWRYASIGELELIFVAGLTAALLSFIGGAVLLPDMGLIPMRVPLSILFTNGLLGIGIPAAPRLLVRIGGWRTLSSGVVRDRNMNRVLIAGAGAAGQMIVRELRDNVQLGLIPVGFVDDDWQKHGHRLGNLPVFGPLSGIADAVRKHQIDEVIIAMPSAPGAIIREVVRGAMNAGAKTRTMPGLTDILSGRVHVSALREIEIQDLLRREPVRTNLDQVRNLAGAKTVLVTGAGGSIGSELARQIAQLSPARLLLLGHGENPIFHVLNELRAAYPGLDIVPVIADIRDRQRIMRAFEQHRPFAVFHAAAHKHVPLMESNVYEAVTNNVKGTQNIVDASVEFDVQHFVLISSDKAVRPTSVMGSTKRIAEHVVRHAALRHKKNFVAVRFGNVLGSQGSVVPTFVQQIRRGGPVTVTHPEMRRYFMTIPEAVQLVLQAGALGRGGELFMLDMGDPVMVVDLAKDLIRLSGLELGTDIEIEYTGLRPGEKLYEEMFFDSESAEPTDHPKVLCARDSFESWEMHLIEALVQSSYDGASEDELRRQIKLIVPDYTGYKDAAASPSPSFGVASQKLA